MLFVFEIFFPHLDLFQITKMKIKFLILTLFTLVLCAEPPKLYRVPLTRIERTTTEKK